MTSPPEYEDTQERTPDTDTSRRPSETVDPLLRVRMQRSFGQDLGDVRIHIGAGVR